MLLELFRKNASSAANVVRQSTSHGEEIEIRELDVLMASPISNQTQSVNYSSLILKEHILQQDYESIIHQQSPDELNEHQHLPSAVDEYNVLVHAAESKEFGAHSCHSEAMCDHEEPHCETEISSEYLTIM